MMLESFIFSFSSERYIQTKNVVETIEVPNVNTGYTIVFVPVNTYFHLIVLKSDVNKLLHN